MAIQALIYYVKNHLKSKQFSSQLMKNSLRRTTLVVSKVNLVMLASVPASFQEKQQFVKWLLIWWTMKVLLACPKLVLSKFKQVKRYSAGKIWVEVNIRLILPQWTIKLIDFLVTKTTTTSIMISAAKTN